ncbi:hypothetical protein M3Y94_00461800 [Aphelenchoides besseyi]|nr:hypothetical protein M3Y94_00461800 [Aphelenchoides besseyi]
MSRCQTSLNRTNQLRRDVRELKSIVKSKDKKIEQLQKQLEEKNDAKITHDEATIELENYAAYEEESRRETKKMLRIVFATFLLSGLGGIDMNNRSDPCH